MPITTGNHPTALWPGVEDFYGAKYAEKPELWNQVFQVKSSDQAFEREVEVKGFGLPVIKSEGASITYDAEFQGDVKDYLPVVYGLGYIVTEEEIEDNLYKQVGEERAGRLAFSMRQGKEVIHANIFNNGFDSNFVGANGVELFSTAQVTEDGTQSNHIATAADLSETVLEDLVIQIRKATNSKGLTVKLEPEMLLIPVDLEFEARRILESLLQNDTANNAVNVLRSSGVFPKGILVNSFYTDTDAFYIQTDAPNGLTTFQRRERRFQQDNDFGTGNALAKSDERYSTGWTDFRGAFASPGA